MALETVGAAWKPRNPASKAFASGNLKIDGVNHRIVIFGVSAGEKRSPKSPDFTIALATDDGPRPGASSEASSEVPATDGVIPATTDVIPAS